MPLAEARRRLDGSGLAGAGTLTGSPTGFAATLPARTATLARVQLSSGVMNLILNDGFETGDFSRWAP